MGRNHEEQIDREVAEANRAQHTPGPWTLDFFSRGIEADGKRIANVADVTWRNPIRQQGQDGSEANYEEIANARLISAAPDLLAACKAIALLGPTPQTMPLIRAAIARAEGK